MDDLLDIFALLTYEIQHTTWHYELDSLTQLDVRHLSK
jgi:hypothetical protein